jgi:predicted nucleic acid-binding protein
MGLVIDSSVLIGLERRGYRPDEITLLTGSNEIVMSSVTVSELSYGIHVADSVARRERRQQFVDALVAMIPVLPFDVDVARFHAELWARMSAAGQRIGSHDLLIAATALFWQYEVLSDDLSDFGRVPDLIVRQPIWPVA